MSKKVYIFLADGFEDIEGLTVVDLMFLDEKAENAAGKSVGALRCLYESGSTLLMSILVKA